MSILKKLNWQKVGRVIATILMVAVMVLPATYQLLDFRTVSADANIEYWYGGTGNWSDYTNHWSYNSGNSPASPAAHVPAATNNAIFDNASFTGVGQIVTIDATSTCLSMDWTGATHTPTLAIGGNINLYGNMTLIPAMTWSGGNTLYIY